MKRFNNQFMGATNHSYQISTTSIKINVMKNYESLNDALSGLKKKGYEDDFITTSFSLYCSDLDLKLDSESFHIDEIDGVKGHSNGSNCTDGLTSKNI